MTALPGGSPALRLAPRPLGRTGLSATPLALGGLAIRGAAPPAPGLSPEDVERAFHEHGVNTFFVTRHMTALAEGVRRLVRAGHREELTLVSAASLPFGWAVRGAWEKNARALGVDSIDVWLLGWVRARWHVRGGTWRAMRRLKEEGKVRALGFSCHDRILAAELARELAVDVLMIRYNAAHRGAEREIFESLGPGCPPVISYTATRWGMLLVPLPEHGFPNALTAPECYRFVLAHPGVGVALCAARSYQEIRDDVAGVLAGPLPPDRYEEARRFGDAVHAAARGGFRWMFRQG
ncbi:MAG: aldo/keto reductase [Planctomycetes bacterium]|nr:aldo/keto reductase [Planctomycetota bacterium]